jgi:hypothetical protein
MKQFTKQIVNIKEWQIQHKPGFQYNIVDVIQT